MAMDKGRAMRNLCGVMLSVICLCSFASARLAQHASYEEVPRNHWAYKAYAQLVRAGIYSSSPRRMDVYYSRMHATWKGLTRYEFAILTNNALVTLQARKKQIRGKQTTQQIAAQRTVNKLAIEFRQERAQLLPVR